MRIALDSGGTFTDCVYVSGGRLRLLKVPSTLGNPSDAIADILERILAESTGLAAGKGLDLLCGTTVGTNALLERRGGRVALVTTAGFEDLLEIGRQARPRLYDWFVERPEPLVPAGRRFGIRERLDSAGRALLRPSRRDLARVVRAVRSARPDAVAVCLLFSFANPTHERSVGAALRGLGVPVTLSSEVLPEFREFERTATTVANAYLIPVMSRYLGQAARRVAGLWPCSDGAPRVRVMQSNGGIVSADVAAREPVRTILSGPAGGILGAEFVAGLAEFERIITFDMGGTSTDVALLDGAPRTTNEAVVAGVPVAVPVLDIHTVGAGGGSIARFDRAGALRVGPESAGADPGPICYGKGELPTVTDAQLVLGRISPEGFLAGEFRLDPDRARVYMSRALQSARGRLRSLEEFAQGILDVADATMEKAIRVISIERGHDPRDYTLVAFGGAGGLHACGLAAALRLPRVLVPQLPGGLSAMGILRADVVKEYSRTVRLSGLSQRETQKRLAAAFSLLESAGAGDMVREGFSGPRILRLLDCRYSGQGYELTIPATRDFLAAFHRMHQQRYGHADPARAVEIVNVRSRFIGLTPKPGLPRRGGAGASARAALVAQRRVFVGGRWMRTAQYDRSRLRPGHRFTGPAVITEYGATSFVPPGWRASVDPFSNLLLEHAPP
jgi:N-methylhydantoinase A